MYHWDPTQHVARKRHYCDSCGASIHPGDTYIRQRWVDGGDAGAYKAHQRCHALMEHMFTMGIRSENDFGEECWTNLMDMEPEDWQAVAGRYDLVRPFIEVVAVMREMSDIEGFEEMWHSKIKFCGRPHLVKHGVKGDFKPLQTDDIHVRELMAVKFVDDLMNGVEERVHA